MSGSKYPTLETGLYEILCDGDTLGYSGHICSDHTPTMSASSKSKSHHPLHFKHVVKDPKMKHTYQFLIEKVQDPTEKDDRFQLYTISNQGAPTAQVVVEVGTLLNTSERTYRWRIIPYTFTDNGISRGGGVRWRIVSENFRFLWLADKDKDGSVIQYRNRGHDIGTLFDIVPAERGEAAKVKERPNTPLPWNLRSLALSRQSFLRLYAEKAYEAESKLRELFEDRERQRKEAIREKTQLNEFLIFRKPGQSREDYSKMREMEDRNIREFGREYLRNKDEEERRLQRAIATYKIFQARYDSYE